MKNKAFSLIELLIVVSIITLLASLGASNLFLAKEKVKKVICQNNIRQLSLSWQLYSLDNRDKLVSNKSGISSPEKWCNGWLDMWDSPDNTNTSFLVDPNLCSLGQYTVNYKIYKCPADKKKERVRTISMNNWVGGETWYNCGDLNKIKNLKTVENINDFISPSKVFVFIDEREDSINDRAFVIDTINEAMVDFPASYHNNSANLSFADGHIGSKKWEDIRTTPPISNKSLILNQEQLHNKDITWLQIHSQNH